MLVDRFRACVTTCPLINPPRRHRNQPHPLHVRWNSIPGTFIAPLEARRDYINLNSFILFLLRLWFGSFFRMRDGSAISSHVTMNGVAPQPEHRATPGESGDRDPRHQITSPGIGKPQEQHQPPRSHPGTPQPMAYRPTPPAPVVPYHVPNQVKVISCQLPSESSSLF